MQRVHSGRQAALGVTRGRPPEWRWGLALLITLSVVSNNASQQANTLGVCAGRQTPETQKHMVDHTLRGAEVPDQQAAALPAAAGAGAGDGRAAGVQRPVLRRAGRGLRRGLPRVLRGPRARRPRRGARHREQRHDRALPDPGEARAGPRGGEETGKEREAEDRERTSPADAALRFVWRGGLQASGPKGAGLVHALVGPQLLAMAALTLALDLGYPAGKAWLLLPTSALTDFASPRAAGGRPAWDSSSLVWNAWLSSVPCRGGPARCTGSGAPLPRWTRVSAACLLGNCGLALLQNVSNVGLLGDVGPVTFQVLGSVRPPRTVQKEREKI